LATSIYIYENLATYNKIYGENRDDEMRETPLLDMYVNGEQLYVLTNTSLHKEQPQLQRTIVHFRNKTLGEWESGKEVLVKFGCLRFNVKKEMLEIYPKFLRKPRLSMRVGRYYGDLEKGKIKIDYSLRFYDLFRDRINLILEEKDG
tara:strand:- start:3856 stop:4296 length:441 start_codon:yes stop_codon:yes gene_type:complete